MSLTAEFQLLSKELPLVDVATAMSDLSFQLIDEQQTQSGPVIFIIRATGRSFDGMSTALKESPDIREHILISEVGPTRTYHLVLSGPYPAEMDELSSQRMVIERLTFTVQGWRIKIQFPNRDEFNEYREFSRKMGLSFHLERLYESTSTDAGLIGLSDKQREALLTAYEEGYFKVPQQVSLDDVATTLEISRSALAERLRRAQSHLIEQFYYADRY
ncbi:helix-turn-helix domain-containing protein [Halocatena marina]|uniref:Helix-turn-helix domain-containing protein n=1 Tax=Halocatena marina TaxID=2934937 RepID=A0ABD5YYN1_9EURY|nr:helix-turn-helix domain-containing protein [Halocatena marina]